MQSFGSNNPTEAHHPYPARDAERSLHPFDDEGTKTARKTEAPIGVFDSGVGGLTILSALQQELPHENYIYYGDTAHCPYGVRSDAEITELTIRASRFLIEQGVKLIVLACNTASQAALNSLRATFSIPFVGVVPAVKPAARATQKGRIGVAATNQAAKALYLHQLIDEFAGGIQVYAVGCPELVTLVERGEFDGPVTEQIVRAALQPLLVQDVDVIVLGCTHFPALRPVIERVAGSHVQIIDSGKAVARRTRSVLDTEGLIYPPEQRGYGNDWNRVPASSPGVPARGIPTMDEASDPANARVPARGTPTMDEASDPANANDPTQGGLHVWCSGDPVAFSAVASKLLGYPVVVQQDKT